MYKLVTIGIIVNLLSVKINLDLLDKVDPPLLTPKTTTPASPEELSPEEIEAIEAKKKSEELYHSGMKLINSSNVVPSVLKYFFIFYL